MTMRRIILTYGTIAGLILVASLLAAVTVSQYGDGVGMAFGYLSMLVALGMVFVGVKRYRDDQPGGSIRFAPAFMLGLGVSLFAMLFYVLGWEIYLFATDYTFAPDYVARYIEQQRAAGMAPAELAALGTEMQGFLQMYESPLMRMGLTFTEPAPVALLVTVVSAALLRNPAFLPARR